MTVAALLDLGANFEKLQTVLKSLPDQEFKVEVSRVKKNALNACDFSVTLTNGAANNDHDMHYLFGESEGSQPSHPHEDVHHEEHHHHHHHEHRHLSDIENLINQTNATVKAKGACQTNFPYCCRGRIQSAWRVDSRGALSRSGCLGLHCGYFVRCSAD